MNTITINGEEYIKKSCVETQAEPFEGLEYKIVRTYSAGVFAGYVKEVDGDNITLINARRLWYWDGAASLSQLAVDGVSKPDNCKFPTSISLTLRCWIEIIDVTEIAQKSIDGVAIWEV